MPKNKKSFRILLVDDEPTLLELYQEILVGGGYDVTSTTHGQEAVTFIQQGGFDLILLDVMLPEIDGLDILEMLHALPNPKKPNGGIVLLTNLVQEEVMDRGIALGVRGYLIKSDYNPAQFLAKIQSFLH